MITNIELAKTLNTERDRRFATNHRLTTTAFVEAYSIRGAVGRRLERLGKRLQGRDLPRPSGSSA